MSAIRPICSVCIANYNGIDLLEACIESIVAQGWGETVEVIVHDDASSDGSVDLIRSRYPWATLIASPHNVGFCVANNRMAAAAQGDYLLLLNNDAALLPDALTTLLDEARRLARPAILGLPQYDANNGKLLDIGSLLDPCMNPVPNLNPDRGEVGMVMGACLWIPRTLWQDLGGFPAWFGSIGEDLYLCSLARLWGYPVRVVGASGYRHHVGASFGGGKVTPVGRLSTTGRRRALSEKNKSVVMVLSYPMPLLAVLLPLHLALLVIEGAVMSLSHGSLNLWKTIYWPCLCHLFSHAPRLLRERRNMQARRVISLRDWLTVFDWMPYKLRMLARHGLPKVLG